jgi:hypothetical protein
MYTAVAVHPSRLDGSAMSEAFWREPWFAHHDASSVLLFAIGPDPGPAIRIVEPIT